MIRSSITRKRCGLFRIWALTATAETFIVGFIRFHPTNTHLGCGNYPTGTLIYSTCLRIAVAVTLNGQHAYGQRGGVQLCVISLSLVKANRKRNTCVPYYLCSSQPFSSSSLQLTICYTNFSSRSSERGFFLGIMFLTCYLIPLCFLALCYSLIGLRVWSRSVAGIRGSKAERNINRSKIRIVRMLVTVTVFFACSWLPLYCVRMRILFGPTLVGQARSVTKKIIIPMAQWLGSANSCMNPFIYCYFRSVSTCTYNVDRRCWSRGLRFR